MKRKLFTALVSVTVAFSMLLTACGSGSTTAAAGDSTGTAAAGETAAVDKTAASGEEGGKISILTSQGSYRAEIFEKMG